MVTDKEYYINSYVPVKYEINCYQKILEGPFHLPTNAGHITYVELDAPPEHNVEAVEAIIRHMVACDVGNAGINFPVDERHACGHHGIFPAIAPAVSGFVRRVRRITGYPTIDRLNDAKRAELA